MEIPTTKKGQMNTKNSDIAIIGMAGKFPGADNITQFWEHICQGKESIFELSDQELREAGVPEAHLRDSNYVKSAPILADIDKFDRAFFKISPIEAELMDPQIRLMLQCAWHTLEDAGYATKDAQNIGVFAGAGGVTTNYYSSFINQAVEFDKSTAGPTHLGNDKDFLSTYISYKLNLTGPSMTIQTACSTSLVALHNAMMSVLQGECKMALAGGVSIRVPHIQGYHYRQGHIFSKSGYVKTFDANADGVVFGSGLGLVLVKRLQDAIQDQDHIYAVIKGSAIVNDGKGKLSYAASSAKGQISCVKNALAKSDVSADTIGFIESHGTGTYTGDPEEVKALSVAFKTQTTKKNYCALGALKSNVGHLEAASGIAALIKTVLVLRDGIIPPTLHFKEPNPRIKFSNTPFFVNAELKKWEHPSHPRRAGVNNLGIGGTNAFFILEEYQNKKTVPTATNQTLIVPLSAKTENSLRGYAAQLAEFIDLSIKQKKELDIKELAYTLQIGRSQMEQRVVFMVSSLSELKKGLDLFLADKADKCYMTAVGDDRKYSYVPDQDEDSHQLIATLMESKQWSKLAALWLSTPINWNELYTGQRPQRISLPTYVFEKERFWIQGQQASQKEVLHPLVHSNTSDFDQQSYSSVFSGNEFFLKDHQVKIDPSKHQSVLPGVAYLEMVRAAVRFSLPEWDSSKIMELYDVLWLKPFIVDCPKQLDIRLLENEHRDRIDFEIYSLGNKNENQSDETLHCQGRVGFGLKPVDAKRDLDQLKTAMDKDSIMATEYYKILAKTGLNYGPSHRGVTNILFGKGELLAQLSLPSLPEIMPDKKDTNSYVLHPSIMDSALQSSLGLISDLDHPLSTPSLPFVLEKLQLIAPCTNDMVAWIRYGESSGDNAKLVKLDIDICDMDGTICIKMLGFSSRTPKIVDSKHVKEDLDTQLMHENFDEAYYMNLIDRFLNKEISIDEILKMA